MRSLPNKTGIVSLPISLSFWISMISDKADRIKTEAKVKRNATTVAGGIDMPISMRGSSAVTAAHARDMDMFLDAGRSFGLLKRQLFGSIFALYNTPSREIRERRIKGPTPAAKEKTSASDSDSAAMPL